MKRLRVFRFHWQRWECVTRSAAPAVAASVSAAAATLRLGPQPNDCHFLLSLGWRLCESSCQLSGVLRSFIIIPSQQSSCWDVSPARPRSFDGGVKTASFITVSYGGGPSADRLLCRAVPPPHSGSGAAKSKIKSSCIVTAPKIESIALISHQQRSNC